MIDFSQVSFSYEKDRPVIRDLSFAIKKGESVGLIGANGAGKSTILKLMLGLLTPTEGTITVDGTVLGKDSLKDIRRKVGFVLRIPTTRCSCLPCGRICSLPR